MTYTVFYSTKFKKSLKRAEKRHLPIDELKAVVAKLKEDIPLEEKYCDHEHHRVFHHENEFARGKSHVNGIENFWSFGYASLAPAGPSGYEPGLRSA